MIEPTPTPSPLLRTGALLARWALWLLVLAWVSLLLAWGALHAVIVPRIDTWRPWVEAQASGVLGRPVRIGAIVARSTGLIPALELQQVAVLDAAGQPTLALERVQVAVSPRSLLGLGFEQLLIENPHLEVRRSVDGSLWMAGLLLSGTSSTDPALADWLFSQPELAVRGGSVRWLDELHGAPPVLLEQVNLVLRNRLRSHALRLDATPPAAWGGRWTLMGRFTQPLLSRHAGNWQQWKGQLYAQADAVDVAALRPYVKWSGEATQGRGSVRAWVDVDRTALQAATLDVALRDLAVRLGPDLEPLGLSWVAGRAGVNVQDGVTQYFTQGLEFDTSDGLHWPGGNVQFSQRAGKNAQEPLGTLQADRLDLAALARIAERLPLPADVRESLQAAAPQGLVESLQAQWEGPLEHLRSYSASGQVRGLSVAAQPGRTDGWPGIRQADVRFELSPKGGTAHVEVHQGAVLAPGVFDDPVIPLEQVRADVSWKLQDAQWQVQVRKMDFANDDAAGELEADWRTGSGAQRFPGTLDLRGSLSRAAGQRVHRYLPTVLDAQVRDYLRASIVAGQASNVRFRLKGALEHFPFVDPRQGEFRVAAEVRQAHYDYAPAMVLPKNSLPWPALRDLSCDLLIDKGVLSLKNVRTGVDGVPGLKLAKAEASITDLYTKAQLLVQAQGQLPLQEGLNFVRTSPVADLTEHFLEHANGTGTVDLRLRLGVPLVGALLPQVQGSVGLGGNDVTLTPDIPRLSRVRGVVNFSESGFSVVGGQARAWAAICGPRAGSVAWARHRPPPKGLRPACALPGWPVPRACARPANWARWHPGPSLPAAARPTRCMWGCVRASRN